MNPSQLVTYKGIWLECNVFVIDNGEEIRIYPYRSTRLEYIHKLPLKCYIQLKDRDTIKEVVEILE